MILFAAPLLLLSSRRHALTQTHTLTHTHASHGQAPPAVALNFLYGGFDSPSCAQKHIWSEKFCLFQTWLGLFLSSEIWRSTRSTSISAFFLYVFEI